MSFLSQPLQNILLKPKRMIDTIEVQVVINENTNDTLTITKQPVQQGASITDHAYLEPTVFSTTIYFQANQGNLEFGNPFSSVNPLATIYQKLLDLQASRVPFDIVTPKRIYRSMLLATLSQVTDKNTENCLAITASFQQIVIVNVVTVQVSRSKQRNPGKTGATQPAGNKSGIRSLADGVVAAAGKAP